MCQFENHNRKMRCQFSVYADFEYLTKNIHNTQPNLVNSFTEKYKKHEPSGYCFKIVCNGKKM